MSFSVLHADCRQAMALMDDDVIDSIVTDPPYGLFFMGKDWDHGVPGTPFWEQAFRVLKPGGHLLAFGGTRTHHRLMVAIEDAGFEIRDCLMWLYGTGFPKSMNISKAIDKAAGAEREVVGRYQPPDMEKPWNLQNASDERNVPFLMSSRNNLDITIAATEDAQTWEGWGTALKPAWEPIILARKPVVGTVADNVLTYGTGGINIDGCRIETTDSLNGGAYSESGGRTVSPGLSETGMNVPGKTVGSEFRQPTGRFPANVLLDESAAAMLDDQSGDRKSGGKVKGTESSRTGQNGIYGTYQRVENQPHDDFGGASRFFYCTKASRAERNAGLDHLPKAASHIGATGHSTNPTSGRDVVRIPRANVHPTVKPIDLMRWLVRLITPPNGLVLDPFCGSGSTGCAAVMEEMQFVGVEQDETYVQIARDRIAHWVPKQGRLL